MTARIYYPALDGARAIAFLLVFVFHSGMLTLERYAPEWLHQPGVPSLVRAGNFGLTLFFTLSAFLVTKLLLVERERTGKVAVGSFLIRRTLRLWPLYFLFLFATFAVVKGIGQMPGVAGLTGRDLLYLALFQGDLLRMNGPDTILTPLWSLGVEEKFYILWPLVLTLLDRRSVRAAGIALIVLAFVWRFAASGLTPAQIAFSPLTHLDAFGAGILLATQQERETRGRTWGPVALLLGGFVLAALSESLLARASLPQAALAPGIAALASVVFLGQIRPVTTGPLASTAMVELGKRSYAAYLFHIVLIYGALALSSGSSLAVTLGLQAVALGATIGLAWLSYRFIEAPFLRLKRRFERVPSRTV